MLTPPTCANNVSALNQLFKNNNLLLHEEEVNKLQEEGDRLVEMKHPASPLIKVRPAPTITEL